MFEIPLASSGLRQQDIDSVTSVLLSGRLTMGEKVKTFEALMAEYLGVANFIMVNSGSSANLLMLESLLRPTQGQSYLAPGDGVIVPAIAWPTTIWPIIQLGLNPIFVDIDNETIGINLAEIESLLENSRIPAKAIFPIHPVGLALDQPTLTQVARRNGLIEIHDVCESLGAFSEGRHAGTSAKAFSVSFYFSHHMTTMEGGGIATDDDALADDLRSMRSHGWSRDRRDALFWEDKVAKNDSKFLFVSTGYNVRPMEIQAAIGINQIRDLDSFIERRRSIARAIHNALKDTRLRLIGFEFFEVDPRRHSWMLLPIQVLGLDGSNEKHRIVEELRSRGVETRPVLTGNFLSQPAIQRITKQRVSPESFPNATGLSASSFLVGCHHDFSDSQIEYLIRALTEVS